MSFIQTAVREAARNATRIHEALPDQGPVPLREAMAKLRAVLSTERALRKAGAAAQQAAKALAEANYPWPGITEAHSLVARAAEVLGATPVTPRVTPREAASETLNHGFVERAVRLADAVRTAVNDHVGRVDRAGLTEALVAFESGPIPMREGEPYLRPGFARVLAYVVQEGDTLQAIAAKTGHSTQALAMVNRIADPDRIWPGEILVLPPTPLVGPALDASGARHAAGERGGGFDGGLAEAASSARLYAQTVAKKGGGHDSPSATSALDRLASYLMTRANNPGKVVPAPWEAP